MNSEKPFHHTHEINFAPLSQETTEKSLDGRVFREVKEVINIEAKHKRRSRICQRRVRRIPNKTRVQAGVFKRRFETNRDEDCIDLIISMTGASAEAIKHLQQKPIFLGIRVGVTRRRANNCCFFGRENTMEERVFAIALLQGTAFFNCNVFRYHVHPYNNFHGMEVPLAIFCYPF